MVFTIIISFHFVPNGGQVEYLNFEYDFFTFILCQIVRMMGFLLLHLETQNE